MGLITYSIPVFFLLIGLELLVDKLTHKHYYRLNDALTNLSCGIGSQVAGLFMKALTFGGYVLIFEQFRLFELPKPGSQDTPLAIAATYLVCFLGVDFFYYWFHRAAHEISFLWGSHIVHHQSEEYNLTVALRQAWLQGAFSWAFYLPLAFIGFDPYMFATLAAINTLYQFWIHTRHIGKLPRVVEFIFNTPSHHRVHHGVNPKYIDRNHAGTLIIWDRLFGTFQEEEEEVVYGITSQANSWNPVKVNFEYWIWLFKETFKADNLRDAIKMLIWAPGWRPNSLGGPLLPKEVTPQTFHKFDTPYWQGVRGYTFLQYIIILLGTSFYLFKYSGFSLPMQIHLAVVVIISILSVGGLLEGKKWAKPLETIRIIYLTALAALFTYGSAAFSFILPAVLLISVLCSIWVARIKPLETPSSSLIMQQV